MMKFRLVIQTPPPIQPSCVDLMFAHRLLAGPSAGVAVGPEALSVTSCSILFLRCCASALCPSGLTLHCSFNNCCGTVNICKPLLQLARPCVAFPAIFFFPFPFFYFFFSVQCRSAQYFDAEPFWYWYVASAQRVLVFGTFFFFVGLFLWTKLTLRVKKLGNECPGYKESSFPHTQTGPLTKFWSILTGNDSQVTQHFLVFLFVVLCETKNSRNLCSEFRGKKSMFY